MRSNVEKTKMITNSKQKDCQALKQEGDATNERKLSKASTSTRQWPGSRNPRIVRVSRFFGGKDRHSKVCTIRGLRDRRIRLSVPTAIQLYDLQDRLCLSQPSKVIDWLIYITKHDIDKLPPLQLPQGFGQFHQHMPIPVHDSNISNNQSSIPPFFDVNSSIYVKGSEDQISQPEKSRFWEKSREVDHQGVTIADKGKWIKLSDHDHQDTIGYLGPERTSLSGLLNNSLTGSGYHHSDCSNLSLTQLGNQGSMMFPPTQIDTHTSNVNTASFPQSLSLQSGPSQLLICPPSTIPTLFAPYPSYITAQAVESESTRQFNNHVPLLSSSSYLPFLPNSLMPSAALNNSFSSTFMKPFAANVNSSKQLLHSLNNRSPDKDDTTASS